MGNREGRAGLLEAAIDRVTRALATAGDELIAELVAERGAMREELEQIRRAEDVVPFRPLRLEYPGWKPE